MENDFDLLSSLFLWVHITAVIVFIIGMVGYYVAFYQAARETNIKAVQSLVNLGNDFGKYFAGPGGIILFFTGMLSAWRDDVPMLGLLQGGDVNWLLLSIILLLSSIPLIFLVLNPRGKVFTRELESAVAKGEVTEGLINAFADKTVRNARIYELISFIIILFLMVIRPF